MVNFTLKQCAYFVAVAEHGGIAQASRVLHISQPAVAQAIDKLEQLFAFRLFERMHARGTELTPQGRAFLQSARALLQQATLTGQDALTIAADIAGIIRLGCFHSIAPFYLAQIIDAHRLFHAEIRIEAAELRQDEILASLGAGEIDLAITYDMSLQGHAVETQPLMHLRPFLLLSENHPLARHSALSLSQLSDEPYVMFDGPSSRDYFSGLLAAQGINPPIAFNSTSMESVRSAVASGLGFSLSVMPLGHSQTYAGGHLVSVPISDAIETLAIVLVRKKGAMVSSQIESFCRFCADYFTATA